jgi:hypothetical protein
VRDRRVNSRRRATGAGLALVAVLGAGAVWWSAPRTPAAAVGRPTTTTRMAASPLCAYRPRVAPWLWEVLVRVFDIRCDPPAATTTTTRRTTTTPTTGSTTTSTTPAVKDCGNYNAANGWPTTTARPRDPCLPDAFAAGAPARLVVYTTTNGTGTQLLKTTYEVIGVQLLRVTADPTQAGGEQIVVSECTQLSDFSVTPVVGGCTQVSSMPVTAPATQTTVVVTPSSVTVPAGQPVTLASTVVTTTDRQPVPAGYVTLVDYLYQWGTRTLDANGQVTMTLTRPAGIYYFTMVYGGVDNRSRGSTSAPIRLEFT